MNVKLEDRISLALRKIFAGESLYETVTVNGGKRVHIFVKDWRRIPAELKIDRLFYLRILHCFRKIIVDGFDSEEVVGPGNYRFCVSLSCLSCED